MEVTISMVKPRKCAYPAMLVTVNTTHNYSVCQNVWESKFVNSNQVIITRTKKHILRSATRRQVINITVAKVKPTFRKSSVDISFNNKKN